MDIAPDVLGFLESEHNQVMVRRLMMGEVAVTPFVFHRKPWMELTIGGRTAEQILAVLRRSDIDCSSTLFQKLLRQEPVLLSKPQTMPVCLFRLWELFHDQYLLPLEVYRSCQSMGIPGVPIEVAVSLALKLDEIVESLGEDVRLFIGYEPVNLSKKSLEVYIEVKCFRGQKIILARRRVSADLLFGSSASKKRMGITDLMLENLGRLAPDTLCVFGLPK